MDGDRASAVADISPSTASAHLSRLVSSGLLICLAQGRHRYYRLAGSDVASLLENMMTMAEARGGARNHTAGQFAPGAHLLRSSGRRSGGIAV